GKPGGPGVPLHGNPELLRLGIDGIELRVVRIEVAVRRVELETAESAIADEPLELARRVLDQVGVEARERDQPGLALAERLDRLVAGDRRGSRRRLGEDHAVVGAGVVEHTQAALGPAVLREKVRERTLGL